MKSKSIHCVTCQYPLPPGKDQAAHFAQGTAGWRPENEAARVSEDLDQVLRYAQSVNTAMLRLLFVAEQDGPGCLGDEAGLARSLGSLLSDLLSEAKRREALLSDVLDTQAKSEERALAREAHALEGGEHDADHSAH